MLQSEQAPVESKLTEKLSRFIVSMRVFLYVFLGVMTIGLLVYFIFTEIAKNQKEAASILAEKATEVYSEWVLEGDEEKKKQLEEKILEETEIILNAYPKQYAAQRALYIRGSVFYENEDWQKAYNEYERLFTKFLKSYLAEEALFLAAVCKEEMENFDESIELYTRFTDSYSESPRTPHAYFSLGRLNEMKARYEEAKSFYNTLKLDYPSSNWTNLAINRIIDLTRRGKISE